MGFLIIVLFIVIAVLVIHRNNLNRQIKEWVGKYADFEAKTNKERSEQMIKIQDLLAQNTKLEKYQTILDAESWAKELIHQAEIKATSIIQKATDEASILYKKANDELASAKADSKDARAKSMNNANELRQKAEVTMQNAVRDAEIVINDAKKRAEEIAGDAYQALKEKDNLEHTIKAMRNIIEGYGDKYIVPTYALLDELADEYSHKEAGERLAFYRNQMRQMIQNGTAAKCDYAMESRKDTAINFVLDAFNGKVDTILSSLKNDNHGTLSQKIIDAYQVVNTNGKAFRNAVITEEYLQVRLQELKWAAIVQEIKIQEREEQRQIKEQIREEEKAKRDFERALREAEKEEDMLKKAMEKVQKELGHATEAQRAKYEAQLLELTERLKVAEDKNQRALSMAQQTRTGHVYVISNIGSFGEHVYKVGMTRRLEPMDRVRELGDASVPFEFDVHSMILSDDAPTLEKELHKKFVRMQMNKVNPRKEFFKITLKEIKDEIDKMGVVAKWTLTSEAREYRESLAIENAIKNNIINEDEWAKHTIDDIQAEVVEDEHEPA